MIIFKNQVDNLQLNSNFNLALQAYNHINKFMPEELEKIGKDDFIIIANRQIEISKEYGFEDATDQLRYVLVAFIFGEQFDVQYELFNEILTKWDMEDSEKSEYIVRATTEIFKAIEES